MQPKDLLPRIQDYLKHIGVSARVVVKGKDTLEIRMDSVDVFTETFAIDRPIVKTHVTSIHTPEVAPKKSSRKESLKGFNLKMVSQKDGMSDTDLNALHSLTQGYSFISATKLSSKVWEATCREVVWMASGFFVDSHKWDSSWLSKMEQKGGGPNLMRGRFNSIPDVIDSIRKCLDYVEDAHSKGNYWWPMVLKGKIPRQSIATFLVSTTRAGTEWSPFCDVFWEMNKGEAIKEALPEMAITVAESIIKESPFLCTIPRASLSPYWNGLRKFVDWYYAYKGQLLSNVDNRVRLADIGTAVTLVKEWNASASGRVLPLTFIYPGSDKWFRFTQWCKTNRNVSIPDYRG